MWWMARLPAQPPATASRPSRSLRTIPDRSPTPATRFALSQSSGGRTFVVTSTQNPRLKGSDCTFITLQERSHLTVTPTGVTVVVDRPTFACS
jgi:hypothetical protein